MDGKVMEQLSSYRFLKIMIPHKSIFGRLFSIATIIYVPRGKNIKPDIEARENSFSLPKKRQKTVNRQVRSQLCLH